ncbi:MAG TPA: DUF1801 domain-containing protein [Terriglobia bacterium]|nr:DUF1801 domain-containing protein [Terriglobia bacterium]
MKSKAVTIDQYLEQLPEDRRVAIGAVRKVILKRLPKGYEERVQYGMIGYVVPLEAFPPGYLNRKDEPLPYVCLASQKNYMSIYMMGVYGDAESAFREEYLATGKKLDMGKCCVRFRKLDDLPLDVIGRAVAKWPMKKWIAMCEAAWSKRNKSPREKSKR